MYFIKDTQLLNFADNNTISTFSNSVEDLITELEKESEKAIVWFCLKEMVVTQPAITYSKLTIGTLEKDVKYVEI